MAQFLNNLFDPGEIVTARGLDFQKALVERLALSAAAVEPGTLFFAIKGTSADGHAFAQAALEKGASAVVIDDPSYLPQLTRVIQVASTRALMGKVASRFYDEPSNKFDVVAVTGTNGKTTTTHLLEQAWTSEGFSSGLVGTIRYQVGDRSYPAPLTTPDALSLQKLWAEMVDAKVSHAAIEASSIALDQTRLGGTRVRVAVMTNLTQDHLDYHLSMENYYQSKKRLFTEYRPDVAVIGLDDSWGRRMYEELKTDGRLRIHTFSVSGVAADLRLTGFETGAEKVTANFEILGKMYEFETRMLGRHNLANVLAATGALAGLGWSVDKALAALSKAPGAPGRLERVGVSGSCEVLVDYAHSEDALEQVLKSLQSVREARRGRIITVFGCGGDRDRSKRPKMAAVVSEFSDVTIATSDNPRTEDPSLILDDMEQGIATTKTQYMRNVDRRGAIHAALQLARPEDVVLIAGKGHETYQILGKEKLPFDDREVVREYFHSCSPTSA